MDEVKSIPGCAIGFTSSLPRTTVVPVGSTNNNSVFANITAVEAKVVPFEGPVMVDNLGEVFDDITVISNLVAGDAADVTPEPSQAGVPLLKDDGLGFDFADGLGYDPRVKLVSQTLGVRKTGRARTETYRFAISCSTTRRCWMIVISTARHTSWWSGTKTCTWREPSKLSRP